MGWADIRVDERAGICWVPHGRVTSSAGRLLVTTDGAEHAIPPQTVQAMLLGPGTTVSQAAIAMLASAGVAASFVGTNGVRHHATITPPARTAVYAEQQARYWASPRQRLRVARRMYEHRFPDETLPTNLTIEVLRGREGRRVRDLYTNASRSANVDWPGRVTDGLWQHLDPANMAISVMTTALYGLSNAVLAMLGMSTSLGFVHHGTSQAMVYDLADLFKAPYIEPVLRIASDHSDVEPAVRRWTANAIANDRIAGTMIATLNTLFDVTDRPDTLHLIAGAGGSVPARTDYG